MPGQFNGRIETDVRDSMPDWTPYTPPRAPDGAPNVLIVLYDDTGLAAWEPYGGRIRMPTMQRLADNGLTYTQWHTTALCSPTRSCFLTGRNHHQTGFACIVEGATGYPGSNAHLPRETATIAQVLRGNGWNTYWVGKDHNVPPEESNPAGPKFNWPLQQGFDRFYGFLGGETNQWYPTLVEDNHTIDQPYTPEEGYHLSKDLADQALQMLRDSRASAPSRPWFMWLCPGANHAPHHVDPSWADRYKGEFDDGYEAYREWVLARMIEKGIMPEGTELTPLNPMPEGTFSPDDTVRPWDSLSDDEKRLFSRMAEVFAGFSRVHRPPGRPRRRLPRADRPARQHDHPLLRRQRRLRRGQPERLGQREQVLQRLAGRHRGEPRPPRRPRQPEHLQPLPDRLGGGLLDAVQDVQALLVRGRHLRPAGHPLAEGDRGARRGPQPVPPRRPTSSRRSSTAAAWRCPTSSTVTSRCRWSARRCATRSTPTGRRAATASTTACSARAACGRTAGRRSPSTGRRRASATSTRTSGSSTTSTRTGPRRGTSPPSSPSASKALVDRWFEEAHKYDVLPLDDRLPVEILTDVRPQIEEPRDTLRLLPAHGRGAGGRRRSTSAGARTGCSPRSSSRGRTPRA